MRVRLIKKYTPHSRELKKGTEMEVTNEKGRLWIDKGIAEEMQGPTKDEKKLDKIIRGEIAQAAEDEVAMGDAIDKARNKKKK